MYHLVKNFRDKTIPLKLRIDGESSPYMKHSQSQNNNFWEKNRKQFWSNFRPWLTTKKFQNLSKKNFPQKVTGNVSRSLKHNLVYFIPAESTFWTIYVTSKFPFLTLRTHKNLHNFFHGIVMQNWNTDMKSVQNFNTLSQYQLFSESSSKQWSEVWESEELTSGERSDREWANEWTDSEYRENQ